MSIADSYQRVTTSGVRSETAVRTSMFSQTSATGSGSSGEGHAAQISSLLREAQSQVQELLPHKEENSRLSTELALLKERARLKEEECRKLQHVLNAERDERHRIVKSVMEEGGAASSAAEQRIRRLEEQLLEKKGESAQLQRDLERRTAQCKTLEEELAYLRQQRQEDAQKVSQAGATLLQQQHKAHLAEKTADEAFRERTRLEELNKSLVAQLHDSEAQQAVLRHDLEQVRKKRNELTAECAQQQGQLSAMQEKLAETEKMATSATHLRSENAQLLSVRDELVETRKLLDSLSATNHAERSSRRVLETERDELRTRAAALSSEVELLQTELHRARCDAAERLSLRAECDEMRKALDAAYRSAAETQEKLQDTRREVNERSSEIESFSAAIVKELAVFRTTLETGVNSDQVLAAITSQSSLLKASTSDSSATCDASLSACGRLQPALWALQPLRRCIVEANRHAEEDRVKLSATARLLETERNTSHCLAEEVRAANGQISQLQLRLAEATGRTDELQRELRFTQESVHDLGETSRRRLAALSDSLHLDSSTVAWDSVFTAASRAVQEAAALRAEVDRLGESSAEQTKQLLLVKQQSELQRMEIEGNASQRMQELSSAHLEALNEANEEKSALREALKRETQRNELLSKELSTSRLNHQAATHTLTTLQIQRDSLLAEVESLRKQLDHAHTVAGEVQKEKNALTEALQAETFRHSAAVGQLQEVSSESGRSRELVNQLHDVAMALIRSVLWHEARGKTLLRERNFVVQYSRMLEDILATAVQERLVAKPKVTFRSAAIAVIAANRLVRFVFRRSQSSRKSSPYRRARTDRRDLPTIQAISAAQLVAVLSSDPSETVQQIQVLCELSRDQNAKETDFALFWKMCSKAKICGFPSLAKTVLATLRRLYASAEESRVAYRRLESECEGLRILIRTKEDEILDCNNKISRSLAERTQLVEKRHVDHLQQELVQVRANLVRERDEKRTAEETAQQLRVREMELLSAQSELQSEARSLAIELAQRTASVDAVSALRSRQTPFTPAAQHNNSSLISDSSVIAQQTPLHRDSSLLHVVGSSKKSLAATVQDRGLSATAVRHPVTDADDFRPTGSNTSASDLFKMISEIDSRISSALRHR
jgi:chromosome segregation ATPase